MKFSQRIRENCGNSTFKNIAAILLELWFLVCLAVGVFGLFSIAFSDGVFEDGFISELLMLLFLALILGIFALGLVLLIRSSIRSIRSNTLDDFLKTLTPYGDPEEMLRAVEYLPTRPLWGMDLRFDDRYLAFARNRDIFIRRMDQIRYFYDYGMNSRMDERVVVILFTKGPYLIFRVKSDDCAQQVLTELYEKSAFGRWILSGELDHSYETVDYTYPGHAPSGVFCDGRVVRCFDRHSPAREFPCGELESCYMYCIPDGDSDDDYFLNLYLQDGQVYSVRMSNVHEGFLLYLRLLNCVPHLTYKFPK